MRKLITSLVLVGSLLGLGAVAAAPASAAPSVKAGYDSCGNLQIWVNGNPTIYYFYCPGW